MQVRSLCWSVWVIAGRRGCCASLLHSFIVFLALAVVSEAPNRLGFVIHRLTGPL